MLRDPNETSGPSPPGRLVHIDMLRAVAAGLVFGGHLRAYLFVDYGSVGDPGLLTTAFYGLTGLGHQAVIVFFAISGFLVGGKALHDMLSEQWSWPRYILRRLIRLWIVIIPALTTTVIVDYIGAGLTAGRGYDGSLYSLYLSGPSLDRPLDHSLSTFLGNIAFLQTVYVPAFGTNGPIWSLANEFWYYLIFPLGASIFLVGYRMWQRFLAIGLIALAIFALPWSLLELGAVWAAGAAAALVGQAPNLAPIFRHYGVRAAAILAAVCALVATKYSMELISADLIFGLAIAFVLPVLATAQSFGKLYRFSARWGAEISYTLYLTHFPILSLIVLVLFAPDRFHPGLTGGIVYGGLFGLAFSWAVAFWWCFERHTNRLFQYLASRILLGSEKSPASAHASRPLMRVRS